MAAVWDQREATVRSVATAVNAGGDRARAYTTILTVMQRLDAKGLLERRRHGKRDVYVAAIGREDYMRARSQVDVDALLAQYGDMAFAHFAQRLRELDPARRSALRRLAGDD
jgi:predicted transcriptional regulator